MSGEQAFVVLVGLFCVSTVGLAIVIVAQSTALVAADRMLRRDNGNLAIPNKVLDLSKVISDPLTLSVYGCTGLVVIGFPERFGELVGAHLGLTVVFGIFCVGAGPIQFVLAHRAKHAVNEYAQRKGVEL